MKLKITKEQKAALVALQDALNAVDSLGTIKRQNIKVVFEVGTKDEKESQTYFIKLRSAEGEDGIDSSEYRAKLFRNDK
jgi:hypothetical protein